MILSWAVEHGHGSTRLGARCVSCLKACLLVHLCVWRSQALSLCKPLCLMRPCIVSSYTFVSDTPTSYLFVNLCVLCSLVLSPCTPLWLMVLCLSPCTPLCLMLPCVEFSYTFVSECPEGKFDFVPFLCADQLRWWTWKLTATRNYVYMIMIILAYKRSKKRRKKGKRRRRRRKRRRRRRRNS